MEGGENMQTMNMLSPMIGSSADLSLASNAISENISENLFQSFLEESGGEQSEENLASFLEDMSSEELIALMIEQLEEGVSLSDALKKLLDTLPNSEKAHSDLANLIDELEQTQSAGEDGSIVHMKEELKKLLTSLKESPEKVTENSIQLVNFVVDDVQMKDLNQQMKVALKEISELLEEYQVDGKLNKMDAAKLTALMKQWSLLMHQAKDTEINTEKMQAQMLDSDESDVLDKLMQRFEKRSFYTGKNMYAQDAHVSKQDVMNWLQQAVNHQGQQATERTQFSSQNQQMPISKVEQYVVHLEHSGKVERVGTDLVNKLTNVLRESQFTNRVGGKMELNLILKPAQLGNVTVKMTQVNGEMMVKMLVSSQAAKDMLEQNVHQLRHLFQPHQVSVERNETVTDEEFYFDDQEEQHHEEDQQAAKEHNQDERDQHDDKAEIDFESLFNQISEEAAL